VHTQLPDSRRALRQRRGSGERNRPQRLPDVPPLPWQQLVWLVVVVRLQQQQWRLAVGRDLAASRVQPAVGRSLTAGQQQQRRQQQQQHRSTGW